MTLWDFADVGFDTQKRLWFVDLFDKHGDNIGMHFGRNLVITHGSGRQTEWPDKNGDFYHIRERIYASDVDRIDTDSNDNLIIKFKYFHNDQGVLNMPELLVKNEIEGMWAYLLYAYSLKNGRGFLECYDTENHMKVKYENKWIIAEQVNHETIGTFPNIRFKVLTKDLESIVISQSTIILCGIA